jgi:hypothetical protein
MEPKNYGSNYYKTVSVNLAWTQPAMQRLREDIEEQELVESRLREARMVLAYIMQKR